MFHWHPSHHGCKLPEDPDHHPSRSSLPNLYKFPNTSTWIIKYCFLPNDCHPLFAAPLPLSPMSLDCRRCSRDHWRLVAAAAALTDTGLSWRQKTVPWPSETILPGKRLLQEVPTGFPVVKHVYFSISPFRPETYPLCYLIPAKRGSMWWGRTWEWSYLARPVFSVGTQCVSETDTRFCVFRKFSPCCDPQWSVAIGGWAWQNGCSLASMVSLHYFPFSSCCIDWYYQYYWYYQTGITSITK